MKNSKGLGFLLALSLLTGIVFQNCSQAPGGGDSPGGIEGSSSTPSISPVQDSGGTYGGLQPGKFNRYVPTFMCSEGTAPPTNIASSISVTPQIIELSEKNLQCGQTQTILGRISIQSSNHQSLFIGHRGGIYDRRVFTAAQPQTDYVEVWCYDPADPEGIESVTFVNISNQSATNKIYAKIPVLADLPPQAEEPAFPVNLLVTRQMVTVRNISKDYTLTVQRPFGGQLVVTTGQLTGSFYGKKYNNLPVQCRLGGNLDPLN